jgi:hypothetical protein
MRLLFGKALVGLLAFDLLGCGRDFSRLHAIVSSWKLGNKRAPQEELLDRVCDVLNHACAWYPKRALCLQRSAVMACLLRHCGIPAEMVLGAQKMPFEAHAWVEVDGQAINERKDVQRIYGVWERC